MQTVRVRPGSVHYAGRYKPFDHQRATTEFLINHPKAFCFNDIGTGKTHSALWAMDHLFTEESIQRCLIVAPKSTLQHVWGRELYIDFPHLVSRACIGTRAKRQNLVRDLSIQVLVINPDGLHIIKDTPGAELFDLLIIDESTAFKTWGTRRHKTLREMIKPHTRIWMMTGSPMPQQPTDIWAQAKVICPDNVARTFGRFRDETMIQINQFKWVPRPKVEQIVAGMIKDYVVRFTRDECLDLPETLSYVRETDMSAEHKKLLKDLKTEAAAEVHDGYITAMNEGIHVAKMLQAACGGVKYTNDDGSEQIKWVNCKPKLEALEDIIEGTDGPVIVYSPFIAPLRLLTVALKKYNPAVVYGGTGNQARVDAFDGVQSGKTRVLLAQPAAMSHGITLTRSNTIVWWGMPFSRETYEQACGRIVRAGQTRKQHIIHLMNSPIERIVHKRMQEHQELQGALLELLAQ